MQEDVEQRMITLVVSAAKLTGRELRAAMIKYLNYRSDKKKTKDVTPRGKQSVKELGRQNQGLTDIEINDTNIRDFDRVARKYGIDYAIKKDDSGEKPKFLVFFKAKDSDALTEAFKEYTQRTLDKRERRESVIKKLEKAKEAVKAIPKKIRNREIGER